MNVSRAMILAAGLGMRMRPITATIPKPMVEVAGRKLIDYAIAQAVAAGAEEVVINTSYLAEKLEAYLAAGAYAARLHISREEAPLETGGGIAKALPWLGAEPFFSLNSDTICVDLPGCDPALARLKATWDDARMDALLLLHPRERAVGYDGAGDFFLNGGEVRRRGEGEAAPYVFTGVQLIHPRLFAECPAGKFSMNLLYDRHRQADGTLGRISAIVHDGDWLHVGDLQGLALAEAYFMQIPT